jgi:hypothetical protein
LADAIIKNRPYYSQHEFAARVKTDLPDNFGGAAALRLIWGNPAAWKTPPTSWRDAAAEEYLRQIYDLVTVRSRNFRIHITGQSLNPMGVPIATSRRISDIYLQPVREAASPWDIKYFIIKHLYEIAY